VPNSPNLVPVVPVIGSYEVALTPSGRAGYKRTARVFTTAPAHAYTQDEYAAIFFRTMPDQHGNVISPVASAFEFASFTNALRELALSAEVVRATPTLVTQSAPRGGTANGAGAVDPSNLFFDSESRAIQQQSSDAEASERTAQLALTARLAAELNRVRTTQDPNAAGSSAPPPNLPPEIPPRLFALPEKQVLVPNALQPNARTDLEALLRMANENIACAMGVPASVIFEVNDPRNATNSTGLIDSPNVRVLSLARVTGQILVEQHVTVAIIEHHRRLARARGQRRAHADLPRHLRRHRRGRADSDHGAARGDVGGVGALHGRADRLRVGDARRAPLARLLG
jgi:hypothetical protein